MNVIIVCFPAPIVFYLHELSQVRLIFFVCRRILATAEVVNATASSANVSNVGTAAAILQENSLQRQRFLQPEAAAAKRKLRLVDSILGESASSARPLDVQDRGGRQTCHSKWHVPRHVLLSRVLRVQQKSLGWLKCRVWSIVPCSR